MRQRQTDKETFIRVRNHKDRQTNSVFCLSEIRDKRDKNTVLSVRNFSDRHEKTCPKITETDRQNLGNVCLGFGQTFPPIGGNVVSVCPSPSMPSRGNRETGGL